MFIKVVSWNTGVQQLAAYSGSLHVLLVLQILWLSPAISIVLALIFCLTLIELSFPHGGIYIQSGDFFPSMHRESHNFDGVGQFSNLYTVLEYVLAVWALVLWAFEFNAA